MHIPHQPDASNQHSVVRRESIAQPQRHVQNEEGNDERSISQLKVLTVGASGPAAGLVVPELRKRGVHVRGLVHKQDDEQTARDYGAHEVIVGELKDGSAVARALAGMDAAFYIAPVTVENEVDVGKCFVALARSAGVRRIVFSSVIHLILSELSNHAAKAPVEEALLDSGLEYVFLHPAIFYQNYARSWAKIKESGILGEPWSNETRFSRVDYRDVAEVAAIALTKTGYSMGPLSSVPPEC